MLPCFNRSLKNRSRRTRPLFPQLGNNPNTSSRYFASSRRRISCANESADRAHRPFCFGERRSPSLFISPERRGKSQCTPLQKCPSNRTHTPAILSLWTARVAVNVPQPGFDSGGGGGGGAGLASSQELSVQLEMLAPFFTAWIGRFPGLGNVHRELLTPARE